MEGVYELERSRFDDLRKHLKALGFRFEERPHQIFLARCGKGVVSLYESGAVVLSGDLKSLRDVEWYLSSKLGARSGAEESPGFEGKGRIGTDEVGKGDLFGPLVVAAVLILPEMEEGLRRIGVKDSKLVSSDARMGELAKAIKGIVGRKGFAVVKMNPSKYNGLYGKMGNINAILGWMHAQAIGNVLESGTDVRLAVTDKFEDQGIVEEALAKKRIKVDLSKINRGGRDVAVASASIIAREEFVMSLKKMGERYDTVFPRGSSKVKSALDEFAQKHGRDELAKVAKLNFSNAR